MATGRVGKKDLFNAIKSWAPKGVKLHEALKTAAEFGVKKRIGGSITKSKATELMQELKSEHVLKSRVGADSVATYSAAAKRLVKEVAPSAKIGAAEIAKEHLAEKGEILKEAGLKESAVKKPTTKAEMHVQKVNMELALDKSGVEELGLGLPWENTATAGYKKGVDAAVSQSERKTPSGDLELAHGFSIPRPAAPKPKIELPPGAAQPVRAKAPEVVREEPATKVESAPAASPAGGSGDASEAVDPYGG